MRVALEALILLGGFGGMFYVVYRDWMNRIRKKRGHKAYFSGGPLDGQTRTIPSLEKVQVYENAIYRHEGLGVYLCIDVLDDKQLYSELTT